MLQQHTHTSHALFRQCELLQQWPVKGVTAAGLPQWSQNIRRPSGGGCGFLRGSASSDDVWRSFREAAGLRARFRPWEASRLNVNFIYNLHTDILRTVNTPRILVMTLRGRTTWHEKTAQSSTWSRRASYRHVGRPAHPTLDSAAFSFRDRRSCIQRKGLACRCFRASPRAPSTRVPDAHTGTPLPFLPGRWSSSL